jgi:hypothetical protein
VAPPCQQGFALEPKAFRSLALSRAVLDSGHSKQTVTNFCVRYSVRSFLAPVNNLKSYRTVYLYAVLIQH